MANKPYGPGTPRVPFDRTMKNKEGFPRKALYPNYYDESGNYMGLDKTPEGGTGIKKNLFGMAEAWQYAPTGKSLDTSNIDFDDKNQVKAIQSAIGADVDGVWGPETEKLYREAISQRREQMGLESYKYGTPVEEEGNADVKNIDLYTGGGGYSAGAAGLGMINTDMGKNAMMDLDEDEEGDDGGWLSKIWDSLGIGS
tara:strand:+ start:7041 stop:7634 length:594 start_codon:yes stop_codon:yes gene_type:complete